MKAKGHQGGQCIQSPCISVCKLDPEDICRGCHRTAAEIAAWIMLSDPERQQVLERAGRRRAAITGLTEN